MLGAMVDESGIRERWLIVREELDERGRRMWAAAEASSHGRGGIAAVVRATAISEATVRRGIAEVRSGRRAPAGRVRRAGAGRPGIEAREAGLREALLALIEGSKSPTSRSEDAPSPVELSSVDPLLYSGVREDSLLVGQH
jgi:hypothetical protein